MRMTTQERVERAVQGRPALADDTENGLALPPAEDGYAYRWIRTMIRGETDYRSISQRFDREGWVPVKAEELPPTWRTEIEGREGRFYGTVKNGDLTLGKIPLEIAEELNERIRRRTHDQMVGIRNQLMSASDTKYPIQDTSSSAVSFGKRRPNISED